MNVGKRLRPQQPGRGFSQFVADVPQDAVSHNALHDAFHGTSEQPPKPSIKQFIQSPNHSSRNGMPIRRVIMHYTTSRNVDGTISHFLNPASRVSAHYVIGRDCAVFQVVHDGDKAWHAKNANADSIGIEHSAAQGDQMTAPQEKVVRRVGLFGPDTEAALDKWVNDRI